MDVKDRWIHSYLGRVWKLIRGLARRVLDKSERVIGKPRITFALLRVIDGG